MPRPSSPAREESSALFLQHEFEDIIKTEIGLHEEFRAMIAAAMVRGWRKRVGGSRIYIPVDSIPNRDEQIRHEFNGTNAKEQCKKWNLSRARLYQILNRDQS